MGRLASDRKFVPSAPFSMAVVLSLWFASIGCPGMAAAEPPSADGLESLRTLAIEGKLPGKKPGETADDISGIACMDSPSAPQMRCLVINDENKGAQLVTLSDGRLIAGAEVPLIGDEASTTAYGTVPAGTCPGGKGKYEELDGEGVAYAKPYFTIVASHACTRNKQAYNPPNYLTVRIRVDDQGRIVRGDGSAPGPGDTPLSLVERTFRLGDIIKVTPSAKTALGKPLTPEENGLDIEGIAVIGGSLYAGLRAPAGKDASGKALILRTPLAPLFSSAAPEPAAAQALELALAPETGIRDLSVLPDGRLLVLTGPAQEQDRLYGFLVFDPVTERSVTKECKLKPIPLPYDPSKPKQEYAKAEGVTVLSWRGLDAAEPSEILVLFDGLPNGGPRVYALAPCGAP
jgi:hypothetical protein